MRARRLLPLCGFLCVIWSPVEAAEVLEVTFPVLKLTCKSSPWCDVVPLNTNNGNPEGHPLRHFVESQATEDEIAKFFTYPDASFMDLSVNSIWETGHSIVNTPAGVRFTPGKLHTEEVHADGLPQFKALIEGDRTCPPVAVYHGGSEECPGLFRTPDFVESKHWGLIMIHNTGDFTKAIYSLKTGSVVAGDYYSTRDRGPTKSSLGFVLAHEFGHSLGLTHPKDQGVVCCNLMGFACRGEENVPETIEYDEGQRQMAITQARAQTPYTLSMNFIEHLETMTHPSATTKELCTPSAVSLEIHDPSPTGASVQFVPVYGTTHVSVVLSTTAFLTAEEVIVGKGALEGCKAIGQPIDQYDWVKAHLTGCTLKPGQKYYAHVAVAKDAKGTAGLHTAAHSPANFQLL